MPVRKIGVKGKGVAGWFYSHKMQKVIQCESRLEKDFCYLLEFNENVMEYEEQPETFYIKGVRYTPDFRVEYSDRSIEFVEVKPSQLIPLYKNKFKLIREYLGKKGYKFRVYTEKDVEPVYLHNLKFLYRYLEEPMNPFKKS